jgi:hypothetical protein
VNNACEVVRHLHAKGEGGRDQVQVVCENTQENGELVFLLLSHVDENEDAQK